MASERLNASQRILLPQKSRYNPESEDLGERNQPGIFPKEKLVWQFPVLIYCELSQVRTFPLAQGRKIWILESRGSAGGTATALTRADGQNRLLITKKIPLELMTTFTPSRGLLRRGWPRGPACPSAFKLRKNTHGFSILFFFYPSACNFLGGGWSFAWESTAPLWGTQPPGWFCSPFLLQKSPGLHRAGGQKLLHTHPKIWKSHQSCHFPLLHQEVGFTPSLLPGKVLGISLGL